MADPARAVGAAVAAERADSGGDAAMQTSGKRPAPADGPQGGSAPKRMKVEHSAAAAAAAPSPPAAATDGAPAGAAAGAAERGEPPPKKARTADGSSAVDAAAVPAGAPARAPPPAAARKPPPVARAPPPSWPTALPAKAAPSDSLPLLQGKLQREDACWVWRGEWAMSGAQFAAGVRSAFEYKSARLPASLPPNLPAEPRSHPACLGYAMHRVAGLVPITLDAALRSPIFSGRTLLRVPSTPHSGKYSGFFAIKGAAMPVQEKGVQLAFLPYRDHYVVFGRGRNGYGPFELEGSYYPASGRMAVTKRYTAKPRTLPRVPSASSRSRSRSRARKRPAADKKKAAAGAGGRKRAPKAAASATSAAAAAAAAAAAVAPAAAAAGGAAAGGAATTPRSRRKHRPPSHLREAIEAERSLAADLAAAPPAAFVAAPARPQKSAKETALPVLKALMAHRFAYPFNEPVDPIRHQCPDYLRIIKQPMDFATIRRQLESNLYSDLAAFESDVRLVFTNAFTYNKPASNIFKMARTLSETFDRKWAALQKRLASGRGRKRSKSGRARAAVNYGGDYLMDGDDFYDGAAGGGGGGGGRRRAAAGGGGGGGEDARILQMQRALQAQIEQLKQQVQMMQNAGMAAVGGMPPAATHLPPAPMETLPPEPAGEPYIPPGSSRRRSSGGSSSRKRGGARPLTYAEKKQLSLDINKLTEDMLPHVVEIIAERNPIKSDSDEYEIDIDALDNVTLRQLQKYVKSCLAHAAAPAPKKSGSKKRKQLGETAPETLLQRTEEVAAAAAARLAEVDAELENLRSGGGASSTAAKSRPPPPSVSAAARPAPPKPKPKPKPAAAKPAAAKPLPVSAGGAMEIDLEGGRPGMLSDDSDSDLDLDLATPASKPLAVPAAAPAAAPAPAKLAAPAIPDIVRDQPAPTDIKVTNSSAWSSLSGGAAAAAGGGGAASAAGGSLWSATVSMEEERRRRAEELQAKEAALRAAREKAEAERLREGEEKLRELAAAEKERAAEAEAERARAQAARDQARAAARAERERMQQTINMDGAAVAMRSLEGGDP